MLYTCVPGADAVADAARLVALADVAEPQLNGDSRLHGACFYRAGQWVETIKRLPKGSQGRAWDWLFLAMAHQRLGHAAEARQCFDKAVQWMTNIRPHWTEQVEGRALRREAETLMKGAAERD